MRQAPEEDEKERLSKEIEQKWTVLRVLSVSITKNEKELAGLEAELKEIEG